MRLLLPLLTLASSFVIVLQADAHERKPLKALLVTGGCCHDYAHQHKAISNGIQKRANVQVDVIWTDDKTTTPDFSFYKNPKWAEGYDIIIHDECAAGVKDKQIIDNILDTHKKIPSVNLHCAMHSFRAGDDSWFRYLGLQSSSHGPQEPISLEFVDTTHPILAPLSNWTTGKEELYNNIDVFGAQPLVMGRQMQKQKDGSMKEFEYIVAWTNETHGARSFSTSIGHNNATVEDDRYLTMVTRGLLWAANKLEQDYLTPFTGQNKVTFIKAKAPATPSTPAPQPIKLSLSKEVSKAKAKASSEESLKSNFAWKAFDHDLGTRWCANSSSYPQILQLDLAASIKFNQLLIEWENRGSYQYKVEVSQDGKTWRQLLDASQNTKPGPSDHPFAEQEAKHFKLTCLGKGNAGGWASVREFQLVHKGTIQKLEIEKPGTPAASSSAQSAKKEEQSDPYAQEGNITPKIVKLTPEQEQAILKEVKVPEGFEVTLFANSAAANYPVYVAAAPNGDLYVSSDGNGSLGRQPKRGRVVRLRDTDGDGRADQVTEFIKDVDSPRGLVWDKDRLYLVHPPHLSVYIDKDGDGVTESSQILVKDIAFGFKDRPADHTTNGLSLGADGWLYIAGGDFGFLKATGTDGKTLQHRGGGVIRVRPDGSNLEIYATGTRNILEVAISPTMEMFTRDNTNDGGGWDVRFHHFPGLTDHGYPRLYVNFPEEAFPALADYGGGSGCGAVYVDEPGFGNWNDAPFTVDWGTNALWHHQVTPSGATYRETRSPEAFVKIPRPTDADVDGMSHLYVASWKGATFNWAGPDVGYIVRVAPKNFKAQALPDFKKLSEQELVGLLQSPSNRRRVEAQRELFQRDITQDTFDALFRLRLNAQASKASRIAAEALTRPGSMKVEKLFQFASHFLRNNKNKVSRASEILDRDGANLLLGVARADFKISEELKAVGITTAIIEDLFRDPKVLNQINQMLVEQQDLNPKIYLALYPKTLGSEDPTVQHTAIHSLAQQKQGQWLLDILDAHLKNERIVKNTLRATALVHSDTIVEGLITRLSSIQDVKVRQGILATLARLYHKEGEWTGDSWGTRPDTRGPYYQPETWELTSKIQNVLKDVLTKASPQETAFLIKEMNRNRIQSNEALQRILALATRDANLTSEAVTQLAQVDSIPNEGFPILLKAVNTPSEDASLLPAIRAQAILALSKSDAVDHWKAILVGLQNLKKVDRKAPGVQKAQELAETSFYNAPKLENHHQLMEQLSTHEDPITAYWATAALLKLSARNSGSPEAKEQANLQLEKNWQTPKLREQILKVTADLKHNPYAEKVLAALDDADPAVAKAANHAAKAMRLERKTEKRGPLISTLKAEDVVTAVLNTKGDVALGEQLYLRQTCVACHTTKQDEAQKGPYLGNIAQTYKRQELAWAILDPNKTIAQGFASEVFHTKDGKIQMGFVTLESANQIKFRTITSQEFTYDTKDVIKREKLPISMMPPGLVNNLTIEEFASLLDYLTALSK